MTLVSYLQSRRKIYSIAGSPQWISCHHLLPLLIPNKISQYQNLKFSLFRYDQREFSRVVFGHTWSKEYHLISHTLWIFEDYIHFSHLIPPKKVWNYHSLALCSHFSAICFCEDEILSYSKIHLIDS